MTTLITGGSKCGKSSLAESIISRYGGKKIYLAAMQPFGDEAQIIIKRHREQRKNKGFETVERYTDIGGAPLPEDCAVLLECIGNLCANEMFAGENIICPAEKIIKELQQLAGRVRELVIVSVQVGADGIDYAEGTAAYIREIGKINSGIAAFADNVIECVFGMPVVLKGELPC